MKLSHLIIIAFLLALTACVNDKNVDKKQSVTFPPKDSCEYKQLKGRFYTDKYGKLFEKKFYVVSGEGEAYNSQTYFDSLVYIASANTVLEKSLSEVIDLKTYTEFGGGTMYSKDKNNVYYSNASSSGDLG